MSAAELERRFLAGLDDAQSAYEEIVATQAWLDLGHESFAAWWESAVRPAMRALSMRPTREIAAAVVERVRAEEAELPPAQRRTQRELGQMVGVGHDTVARQLGSRSAPGANAPRPDLDAARDEVAEAITKYLPPDDPWRAWRSSYLADIHAGYRVLSRQTVAEVVERADETCVEELFRLAVEMARHAEQVRAGRLARYGDNVVPLRSAQ